MSDPFKDMDPADRLLAAGALNLGLGITGVVGLGAVSGEAALVLASLSTVGFLAFGPVLLVAGAYALTATDKEGQDLLKAASRTSDAVRLTHRPIDFIEDLMVDRFGAPENFKFSDIPTTNEKPGFEAMKDIMEDRAKNLADDLLKTPDAETDMRSLEAPAQAPSSRDAPTSIPDAGGADPDPTGPNFEMTLP